MRRPTLAHTIICTVTLAVIFISAAAQAQPPAGWKQLADRHNKCVAHVPQDWSTLATPPAHKAAAVSRRELRGDREAAR